MVDEERGVYMISVAAELANMHPQTLRIYESKGLIQPKRSRKNTRLYSQRDVEMLRRIQKMTTELGLNLAGVEAVLEMEAKVDAMRAELEEMRTRASELEERLDLRSNGSATSSTPRSFPTAPTTARSRPTVPRRSVSRSTADAEPKHLDIQGETYAA